MDCLTVVMPLVAMFLCPGACRWPARAMPRREPRLWHIRQVATTSLPGAMPAAAAVISRATSVPFLKIHDIQGLADMATGPK